MIHPVVARLPRPDAVQTVVSPPYDALSPAERYEYAQAHPDNFLSVILSPEDYPSPRPDPRELGRRSRRRLGELLDAFYDRTRPAAYYIYEMAGPDHTQRGVVGALQGRDAGRVLGHERVMPSRVEALRAFYEATGINTSPVAVMYRSHPGIDETIERVSAGAPLIEYEGSDGVVHRLWAVEESSLPDSITEVDRWYITDGHHRIAAAMAGHPEANVLVVAFPARQLRIHGYHRVVNAAVPADFVDRIRAGWALEPGNGRAPAGPGVIGMRYQGKWHRLVRTAPRPDDPVGRLDVALLHREIIAGGLGVTDETRIEYRVGAVPVAAIEAAVNQGPNRVGFLLEPPTIDEVMAIADARKWLPPKSTWFAPKVRSGLLVVER